MTGSTDNLDLAVRFKGGLPSCRSNSATIKGNINHVMNLGCVPTAILVMKTVFLTISAWALGWLVYHWRRQPYHSSFLHLYTQRHS